MVKTQADGGLWRRATALAFIVGIHGASAAETRFAITSVSMAGSNMVLRAVVPQHLTQVRLELRSGLNAPWRAAEPSPVPAGDGEVTFTIPKPAEMQLFRVRSAAAEGASAANSTGVSEELSYVTVAPLGPVRSAKRKNGDPAEPEAVFHFRGMIDGSDRIVITREGAWWQHAHWDWPHGTVRVNGAEWNPSRHNCLTTAGTAKLLPQPFSPAAADLEVIKGRDVVALELTNAALIVYINDTPPGADEYEFKVHFHPAPSPGTTNRCARATLKIAAEIDGSDSLRITAQAATWVHKEWGGPANITLNNIPWSLQQTDMLRNEGATAFLPLDVDFSTARIVSRKGRDLACVWAEKDALSVWFADNPNGADAYEIWIAFGE
jgi:hypothetical protein